MAGAPKSTSVAGISGPADIVSAIKDLLVTAVLATLIIGPIVGLKTVAVAGGLGLLQRWDTVAGIVVTIVACRALLHSQVGRVNLIVSAILALAAYFGGQIGLNNEWRLCAGVIAFFGILRSVPQFQAQYLGPDVQLGKVTGLSNIGRYLAPFLLIVAVSLPILAYFAGSEQRRIVDLGILMMTYVMLGWGLNVVVGLAGLLDLGYVAFYAVGAYSYALLSTKYLPAWFGDGIIPWAFFVTLPVAGILAALWGIILGFPVLRLRGDYLAIVTLAFGEIIRVILLNWIDFTGGPAGIDAIPRPSFFGYPFDDSPNGFAALFHIEGKPIHRIIFLYYVILALALITNFVTMRLRRLPIGRAWEALREDEIACRSLGINTTNTKLTAFAIGAMFAGFAGSFFATRQGFVSPESFNFLESATILAIVVLGGLGSQIGVVASAVVIIGAFEVFRELDFLKAIMPDGFDPVQYRMIAVGMAMVLIMRWKPRGLVTSREPTVFLKQRKQVSGDLVGEGHG